MNVYESRDSWMSKLKEGVFMYFSKSLERVKFEKWVMCFFVFLEMVFYIPPTHWLPLIFGPLQPLVFIHSSEVLWYYIYIYISYLVTVLTQFSELYIGFLLCIFHFLYFILNCTNLIQPREKESFEFTF